MKQATPAQTPTRCRRLPSNSAARSLGGLTLLEVVISVLLTAIMTASVLSVTLTAKTSGGQIDRRVVSGLATRELSSQLKSYVTTYWDYNNGANGNWYKVNGVTTVPNNAATDMAGPSNTTPSAASWYFTGAGGSTIEDDCGNGTFAGCATGAASNCYALKAGQHTLLNYLPSWFEASPYCARVSYTVATGATYTLASGQKIVSPTVSIGVNWTEP